MDTCARVPQRPAGGRTFRSPRSRTYPLYLFARTISRSGRYARAVVCPDGGVLDAPVGAARSYRQAPNAPALSNAR